MSYRENITAADAEPNTCVWFSGTCYLVLNAENFLNAFGEPKTSLILAEVGGQIERTVPSATPIVWECYAAGHADFYRPALGYLPAGLAKLAA